MSGISGKPKKMKVVDIMNFYGIPLIRWFIFIILFTCSLSPALAQQDIEMGDEEIKTISTLQALASSIDEVEQEILQYREQLKSQIGDKSIEELQNSIVAALAEKEKLQHTFEEIACGLDLEVFEQKLQSQFDWAKELKDLLSPILGELRTVTDRPRELERLKREVAYYQNRIPIIQKSLARLAQVRTDVAYRAHTPQGNILTARLLELEKEWRDKLQQTENNLAASELQLAEKLDERKSLIDSARALFANFFRSRGLNLIAAFSIFIIILVGSRYIHRIIDRVSPWHRKKKHRKFIVRLMDVLYFVLTFVGSILSALIVLYLLEDWVLLALALILLFGMIWAARKGFPVVWQQIQLMLNLGSVREGEIVIVNGLPWMVETINVYTYLINPLLKGGSKRLPIKDLVEMRSRQRAEDEPWFPCREGDWVILADGTRGKVVCQTPDLVELVKLGGSHQVYPTGDFLAQTPLNISQGFRLHINFGLDYSHQALVTNEIMIEMQRDIRQGLLDAGYEKPLVNLNVDFLAAGASSLDLQVLADFSGKAAVRYDALQRLINRLAVDSCNKHGWIIPFTQITLHQA